jgi:hypothetical protein
VVWKDFPKGSRAWFSEAGDFDCCDFERCEFRVWFTRAMFTEPGWTLCEEEK